MQLYVVQDRAILNHFKMAYLMTDDQKQQFWNLMQGVSRASDPMNIVGPILNHIGSGKKQPKAKPKRSTRVTPSTGTLVPQGDSVGKRKVGSKKKKRKSSKKPSLKAEVKRLKKRMGKLPPDSREENAELVPFSMDFGNPNSKVVYILKGIYTADYDNAIASIQNVAAAGGAVDLTSINSRVKVMNRYVKYRIKNQSNSNVHVKYQFFRNREDTANNYLVDLNNKMVDLGYVSQSTTTFTAASATTAERPTFSSISMDTAEGMRPNFMSTDNYEPIGSVTKVILGPGDEVVVAKSFGSYTYRPEDRDRAVSTAHIQNDINLVVECLGDLAVNSISNANLVSFLPHSLIGTRFNSFSIKVADGYGERKVVKTSAFDVTNVTNATFTTNQDPSVEAYDDR